MIRGAPAGHTELAWHLYYLSVEDKCRVLFCAATESRRECAGDWGSRQRRISPTPHPTCHRVCVCLPFRRRTIQRVSDRHKTTRHSIFLRVSWHETGGTIRAGTAEHSGHFHLPMNSARAAEEQNCMDEKADS